MQEINLMNLTLKSINLGGVQNSSPAVAGRHSECLTSI